MNKLRVIWWFLDLCLLAAAAISIGYAAMVSKGGDLLIDMVLTKHDETSQYIPIDVLALAEKAELKALKLEHSPGPAYLLVSCSLSPLSIGPHTGTSSL
jgi:hypothetical protein